MRKMFLILLTIVVMLSCNAFILAENNQGLSLNQKVAQLDINQATLEDVIMVFGEPQSYIWGNQTFTKEKLPDYFITIYPMGFHVFFYNGHVLEFRFMEPNFIFMDSIQVGSTPTEVFQKLGGPAKTVTGQKLDFEDEIFYQDIEGNKGEGYYESSRLGVRLFFYGDQVNGLYITSNWMYETRKSVASKQSNTSESGTKESDQKESTESKNQLQPYADIRQMDLSAIDFTGQDDLMKTLWFSQQTKWPESVKTLGRGNPERLLRDAMNPGLGIRELHRQGLTGKGVSVAIIDQPLYQDHPEFVNKIAAYQDMGCESDSSMHGPAVASLLAGKNIGTAPGVKIYYAAAPSWLGDAEYYAKALEWIIATNKKLPKGQKIRVVSVSAAPSGQGSPFTLNNQRWDEACAKADKEGILVLDCTSHRGIIGPCFYDIDDPDNLALCQPGFPGYSSSMDFGQRILVPTSPRTSAEEYQEGNFSYQYTGRGGLSWAIPYTAGVLALGWQINPQLTPAQMKELLFKSAYVKEGENKIINPQGFIAAIKELKAKKK